jgi:two-component system response regulator HydG
VTPKILIVDDDSYTRTLLEGLFRNSQTKVDFALNGAEAKSKFRARDYHLILMDQRLPDANGLDLLREMRHQRPQQVAILITGYADVRDAVRAVREGVFDYLTKPFENLEELEAVIEKGLELDRAYREIRDLRESLGVRQRGPILIGSSPAIERLLQQMEQVAPLDTTVLLEGESGTGKELVAQLIHNASSRTEGRFMAINCGAQSEQLLESTLFGFEKGAFTGAVRTTVGYLEEADGGTLFLDEIADMSQKLQTSMLRVLQERTFTRLGSTQVRSSDFRLICATNKRLEDEVKEGRFREDLFYRINVVALPLPPLRERREDVLALSTHFLAHFNAKFDKTAGPLTPGAIRALETCPWPGNVRQLQHAIERAVALKSDGPVTADDLDLIAQTSEPMVQEIGTLLPYQEARGNFERDYLTRLLDATGDNVSEAARQSGLSRQNLYVRMKRWGFVGKS